MKINTRWLLWWGCIVLALGSAIGAWSTLDRRATATRGWVDATGTLDLPYRLPLAGVNVELAQYSPKELETQLDRIAAAGFTWVRQPFLWQDIEPEPGRYAWETYDTVVAAVRTHDSLRLVAVLGVSIAVFLFLHIVPGDPVDTLAGGEATPEQRAAIARCMHLGEPLPAQFGHFARHVADGTLGRQCPDAPGRPTLFATSEQFLMDFGLRSVKDLPPMEMLMYGTLRDFEESLEEAAGRHDGGDS
jgi:hypothetical protein